MPQEDVFNHSTPSSVASVALRSSLSRKRVTEENTTGIVLPKTAKRVRKTTAPSATTTSISIRSGAATSKSAAKCRRSAAKNPRVATRKSERQQEKARECILAKSDSGQVDEHSSRPPTKRAKRTKQMQSTSPITSTTPQAPPEQTDRPFVCEGCPSGFTANRKIDLIRHYESTLHSKHPAYLCTKAPCDENNVTFTRESSYKRHVKRQHS
ncbi:hypothetical protein HYPSUDRAFT_294217 [Hypholoma sublateritium FD-334 SS-4]|uniref:C2H2-type domain-containing protein n=1 Tax=Hypholoma sublateritium (strain FD-334 SS-4) TaxID=945553 RepID=A0A0D2NB57_HYPSF|nr:hypothetical protein HYPSUDRAFT_294217 [Hypholoma sublateritium FD-334 SS-4]